MITLFLTLEPLSALIAVATFLFGLVLHNVAQAYAASLAGDSTPRLRGFLSTDPRQHLEPLYLLFLFIIGFAIPRQVPVQGRNIRGRGGLEALVWLCGPLALIVWAFVLFLASALLARYAPTQSNAVVIGLEEAVRYSVLHAAVFLIPMPPLDGARALYAAGGQDARNLLRQMESWGPIGFLLVFIVLSYSGILGRVSGAIIGLLRLALSPFGL